MYTVKWAFHYSDYPRFDCIVEEIYDILYWGPSMMVITHKGLSVHMFRGEWGGGLLGKTRSYVQMYGFHYFSKIWWFLWRCSGIFGRELSRSGLSSLLNSGNKIIAIFWKRRMSQVWLFRVSSTMQKALIRSRYLVLFACIDDSKDFYL